MSYVSNITKKILEALADSGCNADIAIHGRTWLVIKKLSIFMQDKK